jgi:RNA recognition motif-containing protein
MEMAQKIYVGNLSYRTTEQTLTTAFSQYGEVASTVVIKDRYTDQSKGFGFVEMADAEAANTAIAALNGQELDGRQVRVNIAEDKPRDSRPPRRNFGGNREGGYNNRY